MFTKITKSHSQRLFNSKKKIDPLGKINVVNIRMLIHVIKSPTSFVSLRIVQEVTYDLFKRACKAMGLSEDNCQ